jgi:hypothetical protein
MQHLKEILFTGGPQVNISDQAFDGLLKSVRKTALDLYQKALEASASYSVTRLKNFKANMQELLERMVQITEKREFSLKTYQAAKTLRDSLMGRSKSVSDLKEELQTMLTSLSELINKAKGVRLQGPSSGPREMKRLSEEALVLAQRQANSGQTIVDTAEKALSLSRKISPDVLREIFRNAETLKRELNSLKGSMEGLNIRFMRLKEKSLQVDPMIRQTLNG